MTTSPDTGAGTPLDHGGTMDGPNTHKMAAPPDVTNWTKIRTTRDVVTTDGRGFESRDEWWHVPTFVVEAIEAAARSRPATDPAGLHADSIIAAALTHRGEYPVHDRIEPERYRLAADIRRALNDAGYTVARLSVADGPGPEEWSGPYYHEHVAGDKHSHAFWGPHSHGGVSALSRRLPENREEPSR